MATRRRTRSSEGLWSMSLFLVLGERAASEVIHSFPTIPNLDLITSGPLPPNPPELFGKQSFRRLLDEARASYDWVLIDTPPVAMVTDPVICARLVDLVVLVVQYGSTKRQVVREMVHLLNRTGTHIAGILLNQVDVERDHYYYSGYYSYRHYGYYGDKAPPTKNKQAAAKPAGKAG